MITRFEPNLKMEVEVSSETLVTTQKITLCLIPNADCRKNLIVTIRVFNRHVTATAGRRSAPLWPLLRRYTAASSVRCYGAPTIVSDWN